MEMPRLPGGESASDCYDSVQLYNEEVHDLLARNSSTKLQIHESKESGVYVAGLREDIVTSAENVLHILDEGEGARHFGETRMNKQSSRSHTVFRMVCPTKPVTRARCNHAAGLTDLISMLPEMLLLSTPRGVRLHANAVDSQGHVHLMLQGHEDPRLDFLLHD